MTALPHVSIPPDAPPRPCSEREAALLVRWHARNGEESLIHLLPALPEDWPSGHGQGLRVATPMGGVTLDLEWSSARLIRATLVADRIMTVAVQVAEDSPMALMLPENEPLTLNQR